MSWITRRGPDWVECDYCGRKMYRKDYFAHRKAANHPRSLPVDASNDIEIDFGTITIDVGLVITVVVVIYLVLTYFKVI
jgi:hypothetical protein